MSSICMTLFQDFEPHVSCALSGDLADLLFFRQDDGLACLEYEFAECGSRLAALSFQTHLLLETACNLQFLHHSQCVSDPLRTGIYILTYIQYYSVGLELKPAVHVAAQSVCNSEALQLCCAYLASAIDLHADGAMLCTASFTATSNPQTSCMATSVARTPRKCCCVI